MIRRVWQFCLILIFLFVIHGCSEFGYSANVIRERSSDTSLSIVDPNGRIEDVYFCQVDNCTTGLVAFTDGAQSSLHCALFDLDLPEVISSISHKSREIDVKLVIDNTNDEGQISGDGVKFDTSSQLSHNKFCVRDGRYVWTGSFNPTLRGSYKNDNNAVIISSSYLAQNYMDEFDELWNGEFGKGDPVRYPIIILSDGKNSNNEIINNRTSNRILSNKTNINIDDSNKINNNQNQKIKIENYFCPEDKCGDRVVELIDDAKESVYFMTFSFTSTKIADALLFNDEIEIKGVFEKSQGGSKYSQYRRLKDFGLDVVVDNNGYAMHHKVFVIDNETVVTGSFNPTGSGDKKNDENIIIIHDYAIAQLYLEEFERVISFK